MRSHIGSYKTSPGDSTDFTIIFQRSLDTGIIPKDRKHAILTPALKRSNSKPSNYRPISLACIASKLMEHIIVSNIMDYIDIHNILSPQQHGSGQNTAVRLNLASHRKQQTV